VGIDRSFSLFNLYVDGGFIILGIFLLSVYLYVTAFRSLMKAAEVARPFRSVDQLVKQQDWGARIGRPWQSFLEQIQRSQFDREDVCSYFQQARKRLSREANADLLRLKISIAAAPLLGLLGTIIGMIETFDAISIVGGSDTSLMVADGISKALITTNAGLMVALPALFITFLIRRKLRQAMVVAETFEAALLKRRKAN